MIGGKVVKTLFDIGVPVQTFVEQKKEGHGVLYSAARGAADLALWTMAEPLMMGLMFKDLAVGVGQAAAGISHNVGQNMSKAYGNSLGFHSTYNDNQQAYTMRQRGLQAIHRNGMNARNVLGSEARMFHRNTAWNG